MPERVTRSLVLRSERSAEAIVATDGTSVLCGVKG